MQVLGGLSLPELDLIIGWRMKFSNRAIVRCRGWGWRHKSSPLFAH